MRLLAPAALAACAITLSSCAGGFLAPPQDVTFVPPPLAPRYSEAHYSWCARIRPAYDRATNTYRYSNEKFYRCVSPFIDDPV